MMEYHPLIDAQGRYRGMILCSPRRQLAATGAAREAALVVFPRKGGTQ